MIIFLKSGSSFENAISIRYETKKKLFNKRTFIIATLLLEDGSLNEKKWSVDEVETIYEKRISCYTL